MTEPLTPPALTFQQLKQLAWVKIPRYEGSAALYALEEHATDRIGQAATELQGIFTTFAIERLISREDALALELVTILELYGRSGTNAARIIVDRYEMKNE